MGIKLILTACIVNFGLTSVQPRDQKLGHQFQNVFYSIASDGAISSNIYHDNLEQEAIKEQRTVDAMREEIQAARIRNSNRKLYSYNRHSNSNEKIIAVKRETSGTDHQGAGKRVIMISDKADFDEKLSLAPDAHLVVASYGHQDCSPCKKIAPDYNKLPQKYPNVTFLKVDVEQCEELADAQNVMNYPTFIFYRDGLSVDRDSCLTIAEVEKKILQHY